MADLVSLSDLEYRAVGRASEPTGPVSVGSTWSILVDEIASIVSMQTARRLGWSLFEASATLSVPRRSSACLVSKCGIRSSPMISRRPFAGSVASMQAAASTAWNAESSSRTIRACRRSAPLRSETVYHDRIDADGEVDGTPIRIEGELTTSLRETWFLP